ncbi:MAG TPA: FAD-dependent oxidoreductase, partial [Candidatus Cybelea sp.]|nr:FAD-dependent oxidoreductase [Candidatus Cybelea sp.]
MTPRKGTAVIGAGMLGLVTALRLAQRGESVTVIERAAVPGGLASSFEPSPGANKLERFYHHIFQSDRYMIGLIDELGLSDRLFWSAPVTACLCGDTIARLDSARSLLQFSPLPLVDRVRLGIAMGILKLSPAPGPYERKLAQRWLRSVAGTRAHNTVFQPLFEAKFGSHAEEISLAWFWARIHDRTSKLGYLHGGFASIYEALAKIIADLGHEVRFGESIQGIETIDGGLRVTADSGYSAQFDRVVATMPLRTLARVAPEIPNDFVEHYGEAPGMSARCLILALDRPVSNVYWINVCEPRAPFTVFVEHTNLEPASAYGGLHLVYLGNYGARFEKKSDDVLLDEFEPLLRRINPGFSRSWVRNSWQFIAPDAQPVVPIGYRRPPFATPVAGLFVGNLFQVYPHDRGQNYAVELAEHLVSS